MLNEMLGIKYPIIQGGMANIATGKFAAAVSNAGGLGLIATGGLDAAKLEKEIADARKSTDKPFGVNLMLMNPDADNIADLLYREKISVITTGAGMPGKYMEKWKEAGSKVIPVVASTALAACGCHLVLFTTGRGTPFGTFVPTMKIATNPDLASRKLNWIDFSAGQLLEGRTMQEIVSEFIDKVLAVASGEPAKNEMNDYREISIFKNGVTL